MPGLVTQATSSRRGSFRRLRMAGLAVVLAAFGVVTTVGPTYAWDGSAFSSGDEQLLFTLTNQDRASAGLNALVNDGYLHTKAEWRAQDMGDRNYFAHAIPPDGSMVFTYMQQDGYCFKVAGENIGLSTYSDATATTRIEAAFMGSKDHRDNILGTWARMGVGAYKAADGRKLYAVLFSIPCGVTVAPPAPVVTPAPVDGAPVDPTPVKTPRPKPAATPIPTPMPVVTPMPIATPTATPEPTDTPVPSPSAAPALLPTPGSASSAGVPSQSADPPAGDPPAGATVTSLRVRAKPASSAPLDSLVHWLFGGLFGW
jgi:uncharacterized protein YkwD